MGTGFQRRRPTGLYFWADNIRNHHFSGINRWSAKSVSDRTVVVCRHAVIATDPQQLRSPRICNRCIEHVCCRHRRRTIFRSSHFERAACVAIRRPSVVRRLFEWTGYSILFGRSVSRPRLSDSNVSRHGRLCEPRTSPVLLGVLTQSRKSSEINFPANWKAASATKFTARNPGADSRSARSLVGSLPALDDFPLATSDQIFGIEAAL